MRFLIDNNLSPRLAMSLVALGHEATHVAEIDMAGALDEAIFEACAVRQAVLVTADSDFPQMLALSGQSAPSVLYLTGSYPSDPERLAILLHNQLDSFAADLAAGAVIAIDGARARIRRLPIGR